MAECSECGGRGVFGLESVRFCRHCDGRGTRRAQELISRMRDPKISEQARAATKRLFAKHVAWQDTGKGIPYREWRRALVCDVAGCDRQHEAVGKWGQLCQSHADQWNVVCRIAQCYFGELP